MQTSIIPFKIVVGGRTADGYDLRASAAGRVAESVLILDTLPDSPAELGPKLGAALFPAPIHRLLLDTAQGADVAGARLQLQLQVTPPELAALPWEWATLGRNTLWQPALRDDYPLVRIGQRPRPLPPLDVSGPLRLLIVCAPGAEAGVAELGHALAGPVRAGTLVADLLRDASPADLAAALSEEPCHLLHIIAPINNAGHNNPRLQLMRNLDPGGLAALLADHPDLRLCSISGGDDPTATSRFAALLHDYHGLTTLALGGLDNAANALFCGAAYGELAAGELAELAVTSGRITLAEAEAGWGMPQLFITPGGEQLFTLRPLPSEPELPPTQPTLVDRIGRGRQSRSERTQSARTAQGPRSRVGMPWEPIAHRIGAVFEQTSKRFAVAETNVGMPARRVSAGKPQRPIISLRIVVLTVALLILAFMVTRVMERPEPQTAVAAAPPPATQATDLPVAALIPQLQSQVDAAVAEIGNRGPLAAPEPVAFTTYLTLEGDTIEQIAERAGSDPYAIAAYNFLNPLEPLRVGRPLVLPIYTPRDGLPTAPIINRGNPANPLVALTFDIELDAATLYDILTILRERNIKATFFITGSWVNNFPDAARAIVADGHEVANHSLTHPAFTTIGPDGVANELDETERMIREVTGVSSRPYFRFPYGESNDTAVQTVAQRGYVAYHWSTDDNGIPYWLDGAAADPGALYGGIILLHGRSATVSALPGYLDRLAAMGVTPTTLGAVLR